MFAWQQLGTWLIARFSVTQLIAQLSTTLVDARPFTWFLQQQYRYGWFIWSYVVSQCNGLHSNICHYEGYNQTSGQTGKYLERLCDWLQADGDTHEHLKVTVFEMLWYNINCMHYEPWSSNATVYNNTKLQQTDNICIYPWFIHNFWHTSVQDH
jgi:hypothetical protein